MGKRSGKILIGLATLVLALVALAAPVEAGVYMKQVTSADGPAAEQVASTVEIWAAAGKGKALFAASGNPMMPTGSYILTQDGGRTALLVNPEKRTYARVDIEALVRGMGAMTQMVGGMIEFQNVNVEKLGDEAGPAILGYPTRHVRYKSSYDMVIKIMGSTHSEDEVDLWLTDSLKVDEGIGVWMKEGPPETGIAGLDEMMEKTMAVAKGMPLKRVSVTTSTSKMRFGLGGKKGGGPTTTRMTTEVVEIKETDVADSTFQLPAGYREIEMMMPGEGMPRE